MFNRDDKFAQLGTLANLYGWRDKNCHEKRKIVRTLIEPGKS